MTKSIRARMEYYLLEWIINIERRASKGAAAAAHFADGLDRAEARTERPSIGDRLGRSRTRHTRRERPRCRRGRIARATARRHEGELLLALRDTRGADQGRARALGKE